jgi:hypothetical protein
VPISHTCPSCARELARVRAVPDPVYALPVVTCPRCAYACVRTKHPDLLFWRAFRRRARAARDLMSVAVLAIIAAVLTGFLAFLGTDIAQGPAQFDPAEYAATLITSAILLVFFFTFAAALRFLTRHTSLWRWVLVLALLLTAAAFFYVLVFLPYATIDAISGTGLADGIILDPEFLPLRALGLGASILTTILASAFISITTANRPPLPRRRIKRIRRMLHRRFAQD